jgi:hypothetical protein
MVTEESEKLALLRRIHAKPFAVSGDIVITRTRDVHLSVVHVLHGHSSLAKDNA